MLLFAVYKKVIQEYTTKDADIRQRRRNLELEVVSQVSLYGSHHRNEDQRPRKQGDFWLKSRKQTYIVQKGISCIFVKQKKKLGPAGENVCARRNPKTRQTGNLLTIIRT